MQILIANETHLGYASVICETIEESARQRGTGIAKRSTEYIATKIKNGNAVIALDGKTFAGFCYIETWEHGKFVANSGLIVHPDYRGQGLATAIKTKIFEYSNTKFPDAKIFGITTGLAVMKINYDLGYEPVTFSELTDDPLFWEGCQTCKNYDILQRTERKMCLCTGMLYDPKAQPPKHKKTLNEKVFSRLKSIKQSLLLKKDKLKNTTV
ncbi:GNAT family N-acetyltransferase [Robertkochia marina]|uniref:GNAT family N-acetyltransferase n=1 Tax=Robertkochia marina TaxID=1227945 RepID=A0A4V3UY44_9FLAO|nr:GNAT family N-acetyltransferase [Robertkochia marina]THD67666.1 GNAT family N-acetyltransferase [Robertkochia marina]TRZ43398.1 GNAT family N-acetyltransferase [Robertkochia marina]